MGTPYHLRPMSPADLPLVRNWLRAPHVAQWWGDPEGQFSLVSGDLDEPAMDQYIIAIHGQPLGYLQCYRPTDWNTGFGDHPEGTRGIDLFIGIPEMLGRGHGSTLIREFGDSLLQSGTPRLVTDPDPDNGRAIRAYEKAGFNRQGMVDTPDGAALLMTRDR